MGVTAEDGSTSKDAPSNNDAVIPKRTRKRTGDNISSSQPVPIRKRTKSEIIKLSDLTFSLEDDADIKELSKQMTKIINSMSTFRTTVVKELKNITLKVDKIEAELLAKAPPTNIEGDLKALKEEVFKIGDNISKIITPSSTQSHQPATLIQPNAAAPTNTLDLQDKLTQRKHLYYKYIKNTEHQAIYVGWAEQEFPFVPARFLPKYINNEPQEEYLARKQQKAGELSCFLQILTCRANSAKEQMDKVDGEVAQLISDAAMDDEEKNNQRDEWLAVVQMEEEKSNNIWLPKKEGIMGLSTRQDNSEKVVIVNDRSYAAVAARGTGNKPRADSNARRGDNQLNPEAAPWTTANKRNRASHSEYQPVNRRNTNSGSNLYNHQYQYNRNAGNTHQPNRGGEYRNQYRSTADTTNQSTHGGQYPNQHNGRGGRSSGFQPRGPPYRRRQFQENQERERW